MLKSLDRAADQYLPYVGHIREGVVLLDDGSVMAMGRLSGIPFEFADPVERNAALRLLNRRLITLSDDNITIHRHFVRHQDAALPPSRRFRNRFAADFHAAYHRQMGGGLYRNDHFISIIVGPRNSAGGTKGASALNRKWSNWRKQPIGAAPEALDQLEDAWRNFSSGMQGYGVQRLGERLADGAWFSEIAEALRLILTGYWFPVPMVHGLMGPTIYDDRAIFGAYSPRIYEVQGVGGSRYGAIFGFNVYPGSLRIGMMDALMSMPCATVISQHFAFKGRSAAADAINLKERQMAAAGDQAKTLRKELEDAADALARSAQVRGSHNFSLAVYAPTIPELRRAAADAKARLANSGATIADETDSLFSFTGGAGGAQEAAYFAQLPGNGAWAARPGTISSEAFAALAPFDGFPRGQAKGRWGDAMIRFRTNAATAYDYIPHVEDVGMTAIFGPIGSGKSALLNGLLVLFDQYMAERGGVTILFDKDRGGEIMVHAANGKYLGIRAGQDSGMAPLRGLSDTPRDIAFLVKWLEGLILMDGRGPIKPDDYERLARGVRRQMRMPMELRRIAGVRQFLGGFRDEESAGARLERWCEGGALGWAFDGDADNLDMDAGMIGIDPTAIMSDETVFPPAVVYLAQRVRNRVDGVRCVIAADEIRAYLTNELFAEMWEDFILTMRKQNAPILLAGQEPEHILRSKIGRSIIGACHTKAFFPAPTADRETYCGILHCTEGEFNAIRDTMLSQPRRFLLKRERRPMAEDGSGDSGSVIVDFDLSGIAEYVAVLSGRTNTANFAARIRAEHDAEWLGEFMNRYKEARD